MTTWGDIFPGFTEPVDGDPSSYRAGVAAAQRVERDTQQCADEFKRIAAAQRGGQIRGKSATALAEMIGGIDSSFSQVPGLFKSVARILRDHEEKLADLQNEARAALARAQAHWKDLKTAKQAHGQAASTLSSIDRQIASLTPVPPDDPNAAYQMQRLQERRSEAAQAKQHQGRLVENAEQGLENSKRDYRRLQKKETAAEAVTAERLRNIDLGDLDDPNAVIEFFQNVFGGIAEWTTDFISEIGELVKALAEGRWGDALWHLSNVLDDVLTVLTVIAMIALVIAVCIPGLAPFALAALTILFNVMTAITVTKIGVDSALLFTQAPNPETGEPMTPMEWALGAGTAILTLGVGKLVAGPIASRLKLPRIRVTPRNPSAASLAERIGASRSSGRLTAYTGRNVKQTRDWMYQSNVIRKYDMTRGGRTALLKDIKREQKRNQPINEGVFGILMNPGLGATADKMPDSGLPTASGSWSGMVDYASKSSMTRQGLAKIGTNLNAVNELRTKGFTTVGTGANMQVCPS